MSIAEEKQMIRQQIRERRAQLDDGFIRDLREALPDYFMSIDDAELTGRLEKAGLIALYRSSKGEVPVDALAKYFMRKGIKCCFPRIAGGRMTFCDCASLDDGLFERGEFGILQPRSDAGVVMKEDIDIAVIPGVADNDDGYRPGQGGGYYDRFFGDAKTLLVAFCYDFQMYSAIPVEAHDLCADILIPIATKDEDDD